MKDSEDKKVETLCRSVFKSGGNEPSVDDFTKKWIELINNLEKRKNFLL